MGPAALPDPPGRTGLPLIGETPDFLRDSYGFALQGCRIRRGESVILSLTPANGSKDVWSDPLRFDPERFGPGRAEHRHNGHAFVPQGPGHDDRSHVCLGVEFTTGC